MSGIELIKAERERQISQEGWTTEHDDGHRRMEMMRAASSYLLKTWEQSGLEIRVVNKYAIAAAMNAMWPWDPEWWKPTNDPIRNLVKAGALIAAEIDRLQRMKS